MELIHILLLISFALLIYYLWGKYSIIKRLPPGPWGWPILGLVLSHWIGDLHSIYGEYRKKYGNVFSMTYGKFNIVVVSDFQTIMEVLKRDEFQGRPRFENWKLRNFGRQNRGILFCDGKTWSEQRRFALRSLRDFGFGKQSMEQMILSEAQELVKYIEKDLKHENASVNLEHIFNAGVLNSLWTIVTGKRFDFDDPYFGKLMAMFTKFLQMTTVANPFFFIPFMKKLYASRAKKVIQFTLEIQGLVSNEVEEHIKSYDPSVCRDFIDLYIEEMNKTDKASFISEEGKRNLAIVLMDLFVAGAETTSSTLHWSLYFLCQYPRVQRLVQKEIDGIIGTHREPSRDDKFKMVYIEAFLSEVHRCSSLLPFGVFHRASRDTEFEGYFIPKGTVFFPYLYAVHNDKAHWGDPEHFRPERFLDISGTKVVKDEHLIPFSQGKRICIGEPLARDTLFLFLTTLLQRFNFTFDPKHPPKAETKPKCMFINSPDPFSVIVTKRV